MKRYIIYMACMLTIAMWSCNGNKQEAQDDHAGHDHSHENEHDEHAHGEGDEIIMTPEQAKTIGLETEVVKPQAFNHVIKTSGQVVAAQGDERTVVATISGVVSFRKSGANEGTAVSRGEALFGISSSHLAEGDPVMKARSAYQIAKGEYDRAELLIVDKLIAQKEYNEIKLAYENARIVYNAISGGGKQGGASIASPISGYIKSRLVVEGQFVNVGDPLMVVTQNNRLQLRADVSERHYKDLQTIRSANFKTPYDNTIYKLASLNGKMISYGKSSNDDEFYIPVNFEFNNIGDVIPGSFVEVFLLSGIRENVLTVPTSSLTDEQGLYFVYCKLGDEEYERREVQIASTDGDRVEIVKGLKVGDEVVTKGAYHVKLASASESIPHAH